VREGRPVTNPGKAGVDQEKYRPTHPLSARALPPFTFAAPGEIRYGWGAASTLPAAAARFGRRPLIVTGSSLRRSGRLEPLLLSLREAGLEPAVHEGIPPEPTLTVLQSAMDACAQSQADMVITMGGGSALDIGKAAAALAGVGPSAEEFFAGVPLPEQGRPIIALPTTSGTGSEVTRVCVLSDPAHRRKASIRADSMLPRLAIVDPELTVTCPPGVTAHSGMDALVQAVEAYVSTGANSMTDALALEAVRLAAGALETATASPGDRPAREAMALASLMAGLALNTARLGLVHGLAHPIGAVTGAAHGLLCGLLLPAVMGFNLAAAEVKYAVLARELDVAPASSSDAEAGRSLIDFIRDLNRRVGIPERLEMVGLSRDDLEYVAAETIPSGSTRANPRPVTGADALAVARSAW
jgi:alcohol dehydrogenase class IV